MTPYSDNIIFVDTEFTSLDPYEGEIISIGLIKLTGEELYVELEYTARPSEWVEQYVLPHMNGTKVSRAKAIELIKEFVGDSEPFMVSRVNDFDVIYLYKLFGTENSPFKWLPIDFASIVFAYGEDPERFAHFTRRLGIEPSKYAAHHALEDAKLLRETYMRFFGISEPKPEQTQS